MKTQLLSLTIYVKTHLKEYILLVCVLGIIGYTLGCCLWNWPGSFILDDKDASGKKVCAAIPLISYLMGLLIIVFTYATLRKNQTLFEAQMIFKYDKQYATKEMCEALWFLGDFQRKPSHEYFFSKHREAAYNPKDECIFSPDDQFR